MASEPTFSNLTYAGEALLDAMGPAVLDPADLIARGLATELDQTKFKSTLLEIDDAVEFQDPSAAFNDQGTGADIDEVNLTVVPYEFHKQIALEDIRKSWYANRLRPGSLNDYTGDEIVNDFVSKVYAPKLTAAQAHLVIAGKTGLDSAIGSYSFQATYNGLYELFASSNTVRKRAIGSANFTITSVAKGTTTVLTINGVDNLADLLHPGNIVSIRLAAGTGWTALNGDHEVLAVTNATNSTVEIDLDTDALTSNDYTASSGRLRFINRSNIVENLINHRVAMKHSVKQAGAKMVIPRHLEDEWQAAIADKQQNAGSYVLTSYQMQLFSDQIVVLDYAQANTIGSWTPNRVGYAYDLNNDATNLELIWLGESTGDKVYRLRGAMKTGISISKKFAAEITLTTPD